jgi:hypothetical protein
MKGYKSLDDGYPTATFHIQEETETLCRQYFEQEYTEYQKVHSSKLYKTQHEEYLEKVIEQGLSKWFVSLDASKPWLVYWILHSFDLLNRKLKKEDIQRYFWKLMIELWKPCYYADMNLVDFLVVQVKWHIWQLRTRRFMQLLS